MEMNEKSIVELACCNLQIGWELIHELMVNAQSDKTPLEIGGSSTELAAQLKHVEWTIAQIRKLYSI